MSDFGAVGDGETDNTRVFQNAVYAVSSVAEKGGGQLYVPPGRYVTGSFNLTSHMTLYLAREAVILGIQDAAMWPVLEALPSYGRGRELPGPRYSSLIHGQNLSDVIITGENGTIDGQGSYWWDMVITGALQYSRGPLVEFLWTDGLIVSNVTLQNSPYWSLHPTYCKNVEIGDVTITAPDDAPNTDGVVADSSSTVKIQNSYISVGGDAIAIKSGWDQYGVAYGMPSVNITICNMTLRSPRGGGFAVGSEMSGGVKDVLLKNVTIFDSKDGILVKTAPGRGGYIQGVVARSVNMTGVRTALRLCTNFSDHPDRRYDPLALPKVKGVGVIDVQGENISQAGELIGLAESPAQGIELEKVRLALIPGGSGFVCTFINGTARDVKPEPCPELAPKPVIVRLESSAQDL